MRKLQFLTGLAMVISWLIVWKAWSVEPNIKPEVSQFQAFLQVHLLPMMSLALALSGTLLFAASLSRGRLLRWYSETMKLTDACTAYWLLTGLLATVIMLGVLIAAMLSAYGVWGMVWRLLAFLGALVVLGVCTILDKEFEWLFRIPALVVSSVAFVVCAVIWPWYTGAVAGVLVFAAAILWGVTKIQAMGDKVATSSFGQLVAELKGRACPPLK